MEVEKQTIIDQDQRQFAKEQEVTAQLSPVVETQGNLSKHEDGTFSYPTASVWSSPVGQDVIEKLVDNEAQKLNWSQNPIAEAAGHLNAPQTAEASRAGQVGSIEDLDTSKVISDIVPLLNEYLENKTFQNELRVQGLKVDEFEFFRLQVIAAFKHLGLDTKKFFAV